MVIDVLVEDLWKKEVAPVKKEFKQLLEVQEWTLQDKFGIGHDAAKLMTESLYRSVLLTSMYKAVRSVKELAPYSENVQRAYALYAACNAVMQYFPGRNVQARPISVDIKYGVTDFVTLSTTLECLIKYMEKSPSLSSVLPDINRYLETVSSHAKMMLQTDASAYGKLAELRIKGDKFDVSLERKQNRTQPKAENQDLFEIPPTPIVLSRVVERHEIVGNEDAIAALDIAVRQLMMYDRNKKRNPFLDDGGFNQFFLFVGDTGTGKTLLFEYALSEASKIAREHGLEVSAVQLDFESGYQDGPVGILRYQLRKVSNSNIPYLIFVDEMESKFGSRASLGTARHEQKVLRELLDFSSGVGYQNNGNFILIGCSNLPNEIDRALLRRLRRGTYQCEGPQTPEEKAKVLYINFHEGITAGYVIVDNWKSLGDLAVEAELSGADLAAVARSLLDKHRSNHFPKDLYTQTYDVKLAEIMKRHTPIRDADIHGEIASIARRRELPAVSTLSYTG